MVSANTASLFAKGDVGTVRRVPNPRLVAPGSRHCMRTDARRRGLRWRRDGKRRRDVSRRRRRVTNLGERRRPVLRRVRNRRGRRRVSDALRGRRLDLLPTRRRSRGLPLSSRPSQQLFGGRPELFATHLRLGLDRVVPASPQKNRETAVTPSADPRPHPRDPSAGHWRLPQGRRSDDK